MLELNKQNTTTMYSIDGTELISMVREQLNDYKWYN